MNVWMTVAAMLLSSPAAASPKPPAAVLAATLADLSDGDGQGEAPKPLPGMFRSADISHDGVPDWVVDFSGDNSFCGSGGCRLVLYVSRPDGGHKVVFDELQRGYRLTTRRGRATLDVGIYGGFCGQAGNFDCRRRFGWDEGSSRLVEQPNAKGEHVLSGPIFQTEEPELPSRARAADARLCEVGGILPDTDVASVPDLDGDGERDLVLQGEACAAGGAQRTRVVVTSIPDVVALTLPGDHYAIDIGRNPAIFMQPRDGCVTRAEKCRYTEYVWSPSRREFQSRDPARR